MKKCSHLNEKLSLPSGNVSKYSTNILSSIQFCQAQSQLQLGWAELALVSSNTPTPDK